MNEGNRNPVPPIKPRIAPIMKKHPLAPRLLPALSILLLACAEPPTSTPNVMQKRTLDQHYEIADAVDRRTESRHLGTGDAVGHHNYRRSAPVVDTPHP